MIRLYLDDIRKMPQGFTHCVRSFAEFKAFIETNGCPEFISFDHDLGACEVCMSGMDAEEWLIKSNGQSMPHCSHVGTGLDCVKWLVDKDIDYPGFMPKGFAYACHSANPAGRKNILSYLDSYFGQKA